VDSSSNTPKKPVVRFPDKILGRDLSPRIGKPKLQELSISAVAAVAKVGQNSRGAILRSYIRRTLKPITTLFRGIDERRGSPVMTTFPYKDYAITVGASRDDDTGNFRPFIQIVWSPQDGDAGLRCFTLAEQCFTAEEARLIAFHEAKAWADRWLETMNKQKSEPPNPATR
jgi:hypothetical protein